MAISKVGAPQGHVAEWLRNGLQNRGPRFNSGRGLQLKFQWLRRDFRDAESAPLFTWGPAGDPGEPVGAFGPPGPVGSMAGVAIGAVWGRGTGEDALADDAVPPGV
jgi:hypothetical protein